MLQTTLPRLLLGMQPAPIPHGIARTHRISDKSARPDLDQDRNRSESRRQRLAELAAMIRDAKNGVTAADVCIRFDVQQHTANADLATLTTAGRIRRERGSGSIASRFYWAEGK